MHDSTRRDQPPPQAECRLVGMLLNGVWHDAAAALDRRHFTADWLGRAHAGISALRQQGKPADLILDDDAIPAGDLAGLRQLLIEEPARNPAQLAAYAHILQQDALKVRLKAAAADGQLALCESLIAEIRQLEQPPADAIPFVYRTLSDVQARPIEWLWRPFIAKRSITLIAGDSDVGKSKSAAAIMAAITTGAAFPLTDQRPARAGRVIILSAEEDPATVLKPALLAAGADPSKLIVLESSIEQDSRGRRRNRVIALQRDIAGIRALLERYPDVDAINIDPITAYLGDKDSNSTTVVRSVLADLQRLAEEFDIAIILQSHFGKAADRNAKALVLGSVAFVGGPRQFVSVLRDPQDPTRERRYFIPTKCNNVPESERTGLAFVIKGVDVTDGAVAIPNIGRVEWLAEHVTLTADDVLRLTRQQEREERDHSGHSGPSIERQAVLKALRNAGQPLPSRRIAEAVYGEELPDFKDAKRAAIRKLLGKMLRDHQIEQFADRTYTLPSDDDHSSHSSHSDHSNHSNHRNQTTDKESVTAVIAVTAVTAPVIDHSRDHSADHSAAPLPDGELPGNAAPPAPALNPSPWRATWTRC